MYVMKDVVVLVPGITGSVLQKDGKDLWAVSGGAATRALLSLGRSLDDLGIEGEDDPTLDDLGDGITAPRLMGDVHIVPGLWRIDGYGVVAKAIQSRFDVVPGQNYFEYSYDWRRDNRVHARQLGRAAHKWLSEWRYQSGNPEARLILIGHSMGGVIARGFLELDEGWRDTRALITFGTPFAGSLNALGFIANGFRKRLGPLSVDLSDALRSMTSVYQLMPVYPSIDDGSGALVRPAEAAGMPHLDAGRAAAALGFHREINAAAEAHQDNADYREHAYETFPVVGYAQPTQQSAVLRDGVLSLLRTISGSDPGGDGTVPRPSAVPQELQDLRRRAMFSATVHASLQNSSEVLDHITGLLTPDYRPEDFKAAQDTIAVDVDDLFGADEEILVRGLCSMPGAGLRVDVASNETGEVVRSEALDTADGDEWSELALPQLPAGTYRVTVSAPAIDAQPVTDVFLVFNQDREAA